MCKIAKSVRFGQPQRGPEISIYDSKESFSLKNSSLIADPDSHAFDESFHHISLA